MTPKIIDLNFFQPNTIASYLVETSDGPIIIETGPDTTFKTLEKGLSDNGYSVSDVNHVFVTHIHLDHSGAAWHFAQNGSTVYVHPRGAPHLINPERLMASAKMIYEDRMNELWGEVQGMPEDRVVSLEDGQSVKVGDVEIQAHETPGHASHHHAYLIEDVLFTGDVAGARILDGPIIPPTPPPDIHVERWHESVDKIRRINPETLYLTHFGSYQNIDEHLNQLMRNLDEWTQWMGERVKAGKEEQEITPEFAEFYKAMFNDVGASDETFDLYELADPHWMNVGGLIRYWKKYRLAE